MLDPSSARLAPTRVRVPGGPRFVAAARKVVALAFAVALLGACETSEPAREADLVIRNARVSTLDPNLPEAEAIAIFGGEIVAVGTDAYVRSWIGEDTETLDVAGRRVVPGFIEGHGHFLGLGTSLQELWLGDAATWEEIVARVEAAAADLEPGRWIRGRGWHQEKWTSVPSGTVDGFPVHDALSAAVPDHPVLLVHASGHASIANRAALDAAGIGRDTPDPPGGRIHRDDRGEAIGVLHETATGLVRAARARAEEGGSDGGIERAVELAGREALAHGVTSFQDAGSSLSEVAALREIADAGKLPVRLWVMIRDGVEALEEGLAAARVIGVGDERFTVRAIKLSLDGALGNRGAWLLEPYADATDETGIPLMPVATVERAAELALEHDYQLCVHAIGDRANREVLDIYEAALGGAADHRWRVEHAQHLAPEDVPRFAAGGVIASMQAVHCTSDGPWVPDRLGEERSRSGAYLWRSLLDSGAVIANGTDTPVEPIDPIAGIHALVTRRMGNGDAFYPEEVVTRHEALKSYTLDAAFAGFEEDRKGSIEIGKLADLAVLSGDILTIPVDEIPAVRVDYTILDGEVVYRRPDDDRGTP